MEEQLTVHSINVDSKNTEIREKSNLFNYGKGKWYINTNDLPEILHIEVWFERPNEHNINWLTMQPNCNEWRVSNDKNFLFGFKYL